jgi:hypothetical protein
MVCVRVGTNECVMERVRPWVSVSVSTRLSRSGMYSDSRLGMLTRSSCADCHPLHARQCTRGRNIEPY